MQAISVSSEDVQRCARLAALHLDPGDEESMRRDMEKLLSYVSQLDDLDLDSIAPTDHARLQPLPRREDVALPGLSQSMALSCAPSQDQGCFLVPKVL